MYYAGSGDPTRAIMLLWDAQEAPTRGPAPTVDKREIVDAAVAIADEAGLEGLTMRRLAERLGVTAMSLYPRIDSKPVLLDLMVDHVLEELLTHDHPDDADWRARLEHDALATWHLHRRHPWLSDLGAGRSALGPSELAVHERQLAAFDGLDLPPALTGEIIGVVGSYVRGAIRAAVEAEQAPDRTGIEHEDYWRRRGAALSHVVTPAARERLPRLQSTGVLDALVAGTPGRRIDAWSTATEALRRGLAYVLDGIALNLSRGSHQPWPVAENRDT